MNTPGDDPGLPVLSARRPGARSKGRSTRRARRHGRAAARSSSARPTTPREEDDVRAHDRLHAGQARVPPSGDCRRRGHADGVLHARAASEGGTFDDGIEAALQRILADPEFIYRGEPEPADAGGRQELSHQRSRAGLAPVVLPVEQHPGRRADRPRGAGTAARIRRCSSSRCGGCCGSASPRRSIANFTGQWLSVRVAEDQRAGREPVPGLRRQPARRLPARDRAVLRQHRPRGSQRPRSADGELHVRQRAAGEALRHSEHLRPAVPPRDAAGRSSTCAAACSARARC